MSTMKTMHYVNIGYHPSSLLPLALLSLLPPAARSSPRRDESRRDWNGRCIHAHASSRWLFMPSSMHDLPHHAADAAAGGACELLSLAVVVVAGDSCCAQRFHQIP